MSAAFIISVSRLHSQPAPIKASSDHAPPVPPKIFTNQTPAKSFNLLSIPTFAGTQYFIGDPTDEEQLYLEFINRSRASP
ncbi:MAG: hypothetical protein M3Y82_12590, partial [Verrucomicrobiota bacterium]|nr:hypothetical protein [Verrucomicrobiota bacterium]